MAAVDAQTGLDRSRLELIATGPSSFAGAGTAHARLLMGLSRRGLRVTSVTVQRPFLADGLTEAGVELILPDFRSDAYPGCDSIALMRVAQEMYQRARAARDAGRSPLLLGTFLFPFCHAVSLAVEMLAFHGGAVPHVMVPAGSDIWQIGASLPDLARALWRRPLSYCATYSHRFADEVAACCAISRQSIAVIPPPLDMMEHQPLSASSRREWRTKLGIAEDAFVLCHCSNMRPVKNLPEVLRVATRIGCAIRRKTLLLLVGPITDHLREALGQRVAAKVQESAPCEVEVGGIRVRLCGLERRTGLFHGVSDLAINASIHDSFNIALSEAMAVGVPVVSSGIVGIAGAIQASRSGELCEFECGEPVVIPQSASVRLREACVQRVVDLARRISEDPAKGATMGQEGRAAVSGLCAEPTIVDAWEGLIARLVAGGGASSCGP